MNLHVWKPQVEEARNPDNETERWRIQVPVPKRDMQPQDKLTREIPREVFTGQAVGMGHERSLTPQVGQKTEWRCLTSGGALGKPWASCSLHQRSSIFNKLFYILTFYLEKKFPLLRGKKAVLIHILYILTSFALISSCYLMD